MLIVKGHENFCRFIDKLHDPDISLYFAFYSMITLTPVEFFSRVWPDRLVREERLELRILNRETKKVRREFFDSIKEFLEAIEKYKDYDVYFAVATRYGYGGKKRDCYRIRTVWADLDGFTIDQADSLSPSPNVIVDSGGGLHAYWTLGCATIVRDPERIKQIEAITRGLTRRLGGDDQTIDITRILRVPDFYNYKYDPPRKVKAYLYQNTQPYSLEFFKRAGIFIEKTGIADTEILGNGKIVTNLSEKIRKMLDSTGGENYEGDTSRADSAVITSMLSYGVSPENTYTTFLASKRGKQAIERKSGHVEDYVQRTIRKAISFLGKSNGNISVSIDFSKKMIEPEGDGIITRKASQVEVESPRWLWPSYIPFGKITILAGDPGLGKSTLALDLISRVSRGTFLPTGGRVKGRGTSLVASAEDAAEDTIVPRLIAAKADLNKVEIMRLVKIDDETKYLSFPRDINRLRDIIISKGARLVVIDPLAAFLSKETDSYRDQDIRGVLAPVENIAEETGVAIIIIAHNNKKEESNTALYRVGGSIGFTGAARSVLGVIAIPQKSTRVLYSLKSNLSKKPPAIEFEPRELNRSREGNEWVGEEKIKASVIRWMGEVDFDPSQGAILRENAEDAAKSFLRQIIFDTEVVTDEIFKEARMAGISKGQLMRLRETIGIRSRRRRDGKWVWGWPQSS